MKEKLTLAQVHAWLKWAGESLESKRGCVLVTNLEAETKGRLVGTGQPTIPGGQELDYVLVSKRLEGLIHIALDPLVPFKPHHTLKVSSTLHSFPRLCGRRQGIGRKRNRQSKLYSLIKLMRTMHLCVSRVSPRRWNKVFARTVPKAEDGLSPYVGLRSLLPLQKV